eukprot:TRINITY_DN5550_c0_g1_i2.p1 TRINITY_DN5550_c0_g1~~TRINITY_DN5550_c0_g1_i2.p1  ORF type:complete len:321 (+),score=95.35 TRINITY_DN5550_c0_g1_i2:93-1055(+)
MSANEPQLSGAKGALHAFKQQQLKAWQPILTPQPVIIAFLVVGIIFIAIGIPLLIASNSVVEVEKRYDDLGGPNSTQVQFEIPSTMSSPVFIYYKLENYYQNHRRYVRSRNDNQLRGQEVTSLSGLSECNPRKSVNGSSDPKDFYNPCGLIAWSVFNDTFKVERGGQELSIDKQDIAWSSDKSYKFKNIEADKFKGVKPSPLSDQERFPGYVENEDFIVWMRVAALPTFRKLYGKINLELKAGDTITINIKNVYPVSGFNGKKYVVLSTMSWMGGKNPFLGIAYLVVGSVSLFLCAVFAVLQRVKPRQLGDTKYLEWNNK